MLMPYGNLTFVLPGNRKQHQDFLELLGEVMRTGLGFQIALFSTISLCLWQRRNHLRKNQPT